MHFNDILIETVKRGASDLHLKHGVKPVIRRNGELELLNKNYERLTGEDIRQMALSIMSADQRKHFESNHEVDMGYGVSGLGRFRVNIFMQRGTYRMVVRPIAVEVPSLNELHLPKQLEVIAGYERGLVLVTGVTGSGKTTTMASMIDYINQTKKKHIITIEDPIEYLIADRKSLVSQRELGADTKTFANAIRAALRQDPDVILLGEIRDRETMDIALLAAETGHLVISTLHTADARETINRVLVYYEPHEQLQIRVHLASLLRAVVSQRLAKRKDGAGQIPAVEIMTNTPRVREMILDPLKTSAILDAIEEGHTQYGTQSFDQSLMNLLSQDLIDFPEALQLSTNPDNFALRVRGIMGSKSNWEGFDKMEKSSFFAEVPRLELETLYRPPGSTLPPIPTEQDLKKKK